MLPGLSQELSRVCFSQTAWAGALDLAQALTEQREEAAFAERLRDLFVPGLLYPSGSL